ncbi:MAG: chalcone isomerase family protein [Betaproteobacteria bacterium]|nr:chalcone isomerase family protein [Betaproteobacteria bacterium]
MLFAQEVPALQAPAAAPAAQASPLAPPAEVAGALPDAHLHGRATLRFFGLDIYQASLWVPAGFDPARWQQQTFALQLTYLRDLQGRAIAQRSVTEMRRQDTLDETLADQWEARMAALFPDVRRGDRITGMYLPGRGARFVHNGRELGEVADPRFARMFFGIWLAPKTSEPGMRTALLGLRP